MTAHDATRTRDSQVDGKMPGPNLRDGNGLKEFPPNEHRLEENSTMKGIRGHFKPKRYSKSICLARSMDPINRQVFTTIVIPYDSHQGTRVAM